MLRTIVVVVALCMLNACSTGGTGTGVVIEVDGDLTSVESFVVVTSDGEQLHLVPDPEIQYDFPLPHLRDHLRTGEPVVFEYDEQDGKLVVTAIGDG